MITVEITKSTDSDTLKVLNQLVNDHDINLDGLSRSQVHRLRKFTEQLKALNTTSINEGKVGQLERFLTKMESLPESLRPEFNTVKHTTTLVEMTNSYLSLLTDDELKAGRVKIKQATNWNELTQEIIRLTKIMKPLKINSDVKFFMTVSEEDRVWVKMPYQGKNTADILQSSDGGPNTFLLHLMKILINACAQKALSRKTTCPGLEMLDLDKPYHLDLLLSEALAGIII
ncbi:hypothetical protein [Photobacterium lutimaris]|uniref:Uncharacterized protein n=1 Tax=Photobacterium lutimaris TaxID=388278 RepID=A0A2T3ITM7_9GAMM|nr:hypothetical protein [Photobacterium lutimaris]PSU31691.1 hypothetical protein C9I99_21120 [Photobacterium lutimaris]TDR72672.1 hypothetical protein DFP78_113148 [Photobacterium lutimaris]